MEGIRKKLVKKGQTATNTPLFGGDLVQTVFGGDTKTKKSPSAQVWDHRIC